MEQTESMEQLLNGPAMEPPPGRQSNFVNPTNLKTEGLVLIVFCLVVSTLVVSMRMWAKIRLVRRVVLEDWMCCLAQIIFMGFCAVIFLSLHRGVGVHQWNIQLKNLQAVIPVGQTVRILYCVDLFLIKFAILLQLLRVFVPLHQRNMMFWICHALIWLNFVYYTVYIFLAIFSCNPVKKGWTTQIYPEIKGSCLDLREAYIAGAVINTASDVSIVILPQPLIWSLQLSSKRRIGLCAIFLIGIFACAASIVRLRYSIKVIRYEDVSYLGGILDLWAIAEATSGILAMCLPISPKFFRSLQDAKLWSSLKISLHSFVRKSTSGPLSNSETPSEQNIAAKLDSRSISLKNPPFKKYHYITTNELELASVSSSKDSCADGGRNVRAVDDHAGMEIA